MFPSVDPISSALRAASLKVRGIDVIAAILSLKDDPSRRTQPGTVIYPAQALVISSETNADSTHDGISEAARPAAAQLRSQALPLPGGQTAANPRAIAPLPIDQAALEIVSIGAPARAIAAALPQGGSAVLPVALDAIDTPVAEPARFAQTLEHAVRSSGLSYESHLREWVEGHRTFDAVRTEPRAQVAIPVQARDSGSLPAGPAPATGSAPAAAVAAASVENMPLSAKADGITAAQIRCVESDEVRFAIEVWPGQHAQLILRLNQQAPQQKRHAQPAPVQPGTGTLTVALPTLGRVEARIRTSGNEVQLTLATASSATTQTLQEATSALAYGMSMAGLKLTSTNIHEQLA